MATNNATAPAGRRDESDEEERHRLTALEGPAALSLDALLIAALMGIHRAYHQIGQLLGLGTIPPPPHRQEATIVVPLVTLFSPHRSLGAPIVNYLHQLEQRDPHRRLVVLISELEPRRPWQWILHNQRGLVRFRPTTWSAN